MTIVASPWKRHFGTPSPTHAPQRCFRGGAAAVVALSAAVLLSGAVWRDARAQDAAKPFRLCVDPTNPPFSTQEPKAGLYVELGEAIGKALNRSVSEVWHLSYFGKRALRTTLLAGQCDAWIGLPEISDFMGPQIIFSNPFMNIGYAFVVPKDRDVSSLDDLKRQRVAVQFRSTPQNILAERNDITAVTVMSPEEGVRAVADGKADAAFVWAPVAGYLNLTEFNSAYRVIPVSGEALEWPIAVGFSRKQGDLRDAVDKVLPDLSVLIEALKAKYGFPTETPIKFGMADTRGVGKLAGAPAAAAAEPANAAGAPAVDAASTTASLDAGATGEGKALFNGTCAHCHGPDAIQAERKIDLRRLRRKYGDKMDGVFRKVVVSGRPAKGMPAWGEVFTSDEFDQILAYLKTVQTE